MNSATIGTVINPAKILSPKLRNTHICFIIDATTGNLTYFFKTSESTINAAANTFRNAGVAEFESNGDKFHFQEALCLPIDSYSFHCGNLLCKNHFFTENYHVHTHFRIDIKSDHAVTKNFTSSRFIVRVCDAKFSINHSLRQFVKVIMTHTIRIPRNNVIDHQYKQSFIINRIEDFITNGRRMDCFNYYESNHRSIKKRERESKANKLFAETIDEAKLKKICQQVFD